MGRAGADYADYAGLAFFYAGWLLVPAAILLLLIAVRRPGRRRLAGALFVATLLLAYARFIEPRILLTAEHRTTLARCFPEAGSVRIAVASDLHLGAFPTEMPPARVAAAVNAAKPDLVFIAGDLTDHLPPERFEKAFAPFAALSAPAFVVMGNHDYGRPGVDVSAPLSAALSALGLTVLDNERALVRVRGAAIEIVGLRDLWKGGLDLSLLAGHPARPRFVLTHNPSAIGLLETPAQHSDLMVAGHTHGGQVYLPLLTCLTLRQSACQAKRYGFKEAKRGRLFVTSGTGMTALPVRFNQAPRIDVLNINWPACG